MKLCNSLTIIIVLTIAASCSATELNGRVAVINNDGGNYKIMLQINSDSEAQKMGGATFIVNYDTTLLTFSDNPKYGVDFIFSNFTLGYYDTARVTKISEGRLWLNVDLTSDGKGTLVQKGPDLWTDLVELNFTTSHIVQNNLVNWGINDKFWHVYDSDNSTTWEKGNFNNVTTIEKPGNQIRDFNLSQNYPNPFNPTTKIEYSVPQRSFVKLTIYNIIGQEIAVLVNGEKETGKYVVNFDTDNVPSGVYVYRLQAGDFIDTKKMMLLK